MEKNESFSWAKKHTDLFVLLGVLLSAFIWMHSQFSTIESRFTSIDSRFTQIEKDITMIKTVLILKNIMPTEMCKHQIENDQMKKAE